MGQPSAPQIYQQPSQQEQDAAKASNQQKAAALAKLNQSIFAESKGLRGMGGLYEWAGPTPDLAPGMTAANEWRKPQPKGEGGTTPWGWNTPGPFKTNPQGWTTGKGIAPLPPGESPGWSSGHGPPGDRSQPGWTGYIYSQGHGSRDDRTSPGWVQAPSRSGPYGDRTPGPPPAGSPYQIALDTKLFKQWGLPAPKFPEKAPPTPTQVEQANRDRINAAFAAQGAKNVLPATVKPVPGPPQQPKVNPQVLTALGIKPPAAPAPAAPAAAAPAPTPPSAPSTRPAVSVAPTSTPIAPVKPLTPTAVTKPLSNILYQTTVRPSLYSATTARAPSGGGNR